MAKLKIAPPTDEQQHVQELREKALSLCRQITTRADADVCHGTHWYHVIREAAESLTAYTAALRDQWENHR